SLCTKGSTGNSERSDSNAFFRSCSALFFSGEKSVQARRELPALIHRPALSVGFWSTRLLPSRWVVWLGRSLALQSTGQPQPDRESEAPAELGAVDLVGEVLVGDSEGRGKANVDLVANDQAQAGADIEIAIIAGLLECAEDRIGVGPILE